jgi:CubicO group peptidase (beta-lactamase class C family)
MAQNSPDDAKESGIVKPIVMAVALALAPLAHAQTVVDDSAAPLEGLWVSESSYGPALRGDLIVTQENGGWRATIAGAEARAPAHGAEVSFAFPDQLGDFHGSVHGRTMEGFWRQPPGLGEQGYATPLRLERVGAHRWRGEVQPLEQRFTLYLSVFRSDDGRWLGAFRNPEANFNGGASRLLAARSGDAVVFSLRFDNGGETRREGVLLPEPERLRLEWPPLPGALELSRVAPAQATAYLPRPLGARDYVYRQPADTGDGWRSARARDVGLDEAALAAEVRRISAVDPASRRPSLIHSLLVARHGRLVLDEYFYGFNRDTPHDIRSAGKTFASVMLGAATLDGARITPQTRVYTLLAGMGPFANPDPRKAQITLAHLMTHTSGLECNDNDDASPGGEDAMQSQIEQPDWWRYALDLPMAHAPGSRYAYCSAGMNLMGAVLRTVTGRGLPDYFDHAVARPLQFGRYYWNLMPNGEGYLGGGAQVLPRDLLKIGQMYLDGGVWRGRRIAPSAWVVLSTAPHMEINEATTGMDAETFANTSTLGADGYAWHRYGIHVAGRTIEEYEANGNGGQFLIVVPEYDLVVVTTGGNYGQGGIWTHWRDDVVGAAIIGAIRD